jgi:hypothetical protein
MAAYIFWRPYVRDYRAAMPISWRMQYGPVVDAWDFVRDELPPDAVVAYTNTYLTYPLYGFELNRRVVYAPTRRGVDRYIDLPPLPETATDVNMRRQIEQVTFAQPDLPTWLAHLTESGATHLLVVKPDPASSYVTADPPELAFVRQMPEMFQPVFDNPAATIFFVRNAPDAN